MQSKAEELLRNFVTELRLLCDETIVALNMAVEKEDAPVPALDTEEDHGCISCRYQWLHPGEVPCTICEEGFTEWKPLYQDAPACAKCAHTPCEADKAPCAMCTRNPIEEIRASANLDYYVTKSEWSEKSCSSCKSFFNKPYDEPCRNCFRNPFSKYPKVTELSDCWELSALASGKDCLDCKHMLTHPQATPCVNCVHSCAVDKVKDGEDYFESDVEEEEEEKRTCDNCEYRNVSADDVPCVNCTRTDGELDYWTKQIS